MKIVDAQIHLWSQNLPTNAMHRQIPSYSAEDCLKEMDAAGVDAALIHPPGWDPNSGAVAEAACAKYPNRFAILGQFPLDKPESRELIAGWKNRPGMLGLRFAFTQPHQANWMTDGTMDWLWPAAEKAGIPIALMASNQLPLVGQIAERHPGLKLILDHYARVRGGADDAAHANSRRSSRSPNTRTSRSNAPARQAIRASPTRTATSTNTPSRSSRPSGRSAASGAPTSPACRVPGNNA